jgi:hypothetical protein
MRLSAEHPDLGRRDAPRHGEPVSALLRPRRYWNARTCVLRLVDDGLDCPRPTCLQRLVLRGASQRGDRASSVSPIRDPRAASRRASPPLYGLRRHLSALRHGLRSSRPDEEVIRDHGWELAAEEPWSSSKRSRSATSSARIATACARTRPSWTALSDHRISRATVVLRHRPLMLERERGGIGDGARAFSSSTAFVSCRARIADGAIRRA